MGRIKETFAQIDSLLKEDKDVALVVSGDPLMYSLYKTILNDPVSRGWDMEILPGIGSLQMLGAALGETMEDARIVSVHGRSKTPGSIALTVTENPKVFFLCSKDQGPAWLSRIMLDFGLTDVTVSAGANLSYEDEMVISGSPAQMADKEFPALCVAMIKNPAPKAVTRPCFLSDSDFERDKTPMTKEEIRVLILHKMKLHADDIVWDIGAGTGSVSIECARQAPFGEVHAVERSEKAIELIRKNKEKYSVEHLHIYHGDAAEEVKKLPVPDKVFIGGSGGSSLGVWGIASSRCRGGGPPPPGGPREWRFFPSLIRRRRGAAGPPGHRAPEGERGGNPWGPWGGGGGRTGVLESWGGLKGLRAEGKRLKRDFRRK